MSSEALASREWTRLSPRALAVRPITDLLRSAPLLLGFVYAGTRGGREAYWGLALGAYALLAGVWRWFGTRYQITDERVYVKRGILSPKVLSTPRASVRSVDLTAHVIYRALGITQVKIGTGRNDKREGENFKLDAIAVADAEALRALLLGAAVASGEAADADAAEHEIVSLRMSWVRFAPLTLTGLVILGVFIGFVSQAEHDSGVNLDSLGPVQALIRGLRRMPLAESLPLGTLGLLVVLTIISILGYIAVFWRFRLVRTGEGSLRVTRGLFSTRATTIDEARLRGIEISEPLSLRAAKGARGLAITTGLRVGGGAERGGTVLLPPAPRSVAYEVAASVLGIPPELTSVRLIKHGRAALRRRMLRAAIPLLILLGVIALIFQLTNTPGAYWFVLLMPVAVALAVPLGLDRYRSLGHLRDGEWIVLSTGSLVRRRSILNVNGIVGWRLHQTWFQRRRNLVTVTATTAAGKQAYTVQDMVMEDALEFIRSATPDLVTQFFAPVVGPYA